jgi:uncharacterized protein
MTLRKTLAFMLAGGLLAAAAPAFADVKAGVDAWTRGDYAAAVRAWREPAAKGDADAQFNMAQAYRLGRGVEVNVKQAEVLYAKAAAQGHIKAADNYGLLLFQDGRREEAMPYVTGAADRGDPRAQYLLGIAHFNGDLVPKDWVRAYALLTLANSAELPQAAPAIQQMDSFIPLEQRQQAQALAQQLKRESDARRAQQLAAVDLATGREFGSQEAGDIPPPARQVAAVSQPSLPPRGAGRIPQAIPSVAVAPSVAAAQAAIAEAERVTGTENPGSAGADFARPATDVAAAPAVSRPPPQTTPQPAPVARPVVATPRPQAAPTQAAQPGGASGPWKVQLGAFGVKSNADKLWSRLSSNAAIAGKQKLLVPAGSVTKLLAGGYASRDVAQSACNSLKRSGQECIVTR